MSKRAFNRRQALAGLGSLAAATPLLQAQQAPLAARAPVPEVAVHCGPFGPEGLGREQVELLRALPADQDMLPGGAVAVDSAVKEPGAAHVALPAAVLLHEEAFARLLGKRAERGFAMMDPAFDITFEEGDEGVFGVTIILHDLVSKKAAILEDEITVANGDQTTP